MPPSSPLRIVFCHYTADICGGSDRSLFDLVTRLQADGIECSVVLKTGDPLAPRYRDAGCRVVEIPFVPPRRALEWGKLLRFFLFFWPHVFGAAWVIRRWRADIVHVNTLNNLQGAFAATLARKPLVWHVRELVPDSRADAWLRRIAARLATRTVANSTAVADTLRAVGAPVQTVLNGIDLGEYPSTDTTIYLERFHGSPLIVCIGRQEPWKGQHVLLEALPDILQAHPECLVWFVGGPAVNKPDYAAGLTARCEALGLSERVTFTGIRNDIPDILAQAAVLVLPSVTPEPFGRTLVEGMAAGCAVVATNQGGPCEIVEDGCTGVLVPPEDKNALATAITEILNDPGRALAMGRAGRLRAHEHFSLERLVAEMTSLFHDVYNKGRSRGN